jgi:hypothetical protein
MSPQHSRWHDAAMTRALRIVGEVAAETVAGVGLATKLETLEDLLRAGFAQRPIWELREVVVQDEFTHDVVVEAAAGYLVFDTT